MREGGYDVGQRLRCRFNKPTAATAASAIDAGLGHVREQSVGSRKRNQGRVGPCWPADRSAAGALVEIRGEVAEVDGVDDIVVVEIALVPAGLTPLLKFAARIPKSTALTTPSRFVSPRSVYFNLNCSGSQTGRVPGIGRVGIAQSVVIRIQ
jgi:hypothetical protein